MTEEKEAVLPPEEEPIVPRADEVKLVEELQKMAYEPLLAVEKQLIGWSLVLGIGLLGILIWVSYSYFSPAGP